jgi:hypothetical protein
VAQQLSAFITGLVHGGEGRYGMRITETTEPTELPSVFVDTEDDHADPMEARRQFAARCWLHFSRSNIENNTGLAA